MELTREQVCAMAAAIGLEIPEADIKSVMLRLSAGLAAMEEIEHELGAEMSRVEPVPPVYPNDQQDGK